MRMVRSWSPVKKAVIAAITLCVVCFFCALFSSVHTSELQLVRKWKGHHWGAVMHVVFPSDGRFLWSVGVDHTIKLWRTNDGKLLRTLKAANSIRSIAFSPDYRLLAIGSGDGTVSLQRTSDGKLLRTLYSGGVVSDVAFSPDGRFLATWGWEGKVRLPSPIPSFLSEDWQGTVKLWRVSDGKLVRTLKGKVYPAIFSPDGRLLAVVSKDGIVRVWQISDGKLLQRRKSVPSVTSAVFSPDGHFLATGSDDGTIGLWRVKDGSLLRVLKHSDFRAYPIVFSPDERFLVSEDFGILKLWRVGDGKLLQTLKHKDYLLTTIAFSPDSRFLALGSTNYAVKLWRAADGRLVGQWKAEGIQGIILHWCIERLEPFSRRFGIPLKVEPLPFPWCGAFSPDGRYLAAGMSDGMIYLWLLPR